MTQNENFYKHKKYHFTLLTTYCDDKFNHVSGDDAKKIYKDLKPVCIDMAKKEFSDPDGKLDLEGVVQFLHYTDRTGHSGLVRLQEILDAAFPDELDSGKSYAFILKLFEFWYDKNLVKNFGGDYYTCLWYSASYGLKPLVKKITEQSDLKALALKMAEHMKDPKYDLVSVLECQPWMGNVVMRIDR